MSKVYIDFKNISQNEITVRIEDIHTHILSLPVVPQSNGTYALKKGDFKTHLEDISYPEREEVTRKIEKHPSIIFY